MQYYGFWGRRNRVLYTELSQIHRTKLGYRKRPKKELEQVRKCMPARSLFLDASNEVLLRRKENDNTLSRNFFEHHLKYLLPLKRNWFIGRENADVLEVDDLNAEEVGKKVKEWVDFCRDAIN